MKTCIHYLKFMICTLLILPVILTLNLHAQESEYKDPPYFTSMPSYVIDYAEDIEFNNYHFFDGTKCPIVEGNKFLKTICIKGRCNASEPTSDSAQLFKRSQEHRRNCLHRRTTRVC